MSVQSEIDRINTNVQSTLSTIADTGVEVGTNSDALPSAASALANEKANVSHTHVMADITDFSGGGIPVVTTAGTGAGVYGYGGWDYGLYKWVDTDPDYAHAQYHVRAYL